MKKFALLTLIIVAVACMCNVWADDDKEHADDVKLENEMQKVSYSMGYQLSKSMKQDGVELDIPAFTQAIKDVFADKDPRINEEDMRKALTDFQKSMMKKRQETREKEGKENMKEAENFLKKNKDEEGVQVTDSGLQYKILEEGKGKSPTADDKVKVHYKGTLLDGTQFDSSYERGKPAEFFVKGVIPGWTEALQLMKEGSKWQIWIPPDLGYGERGAGRDIKPNSLLIFEVELLEVLPKE
jgi:FKBP-type peptidyl-prolyl cis-trans isomerase